MGKLLLGECSSAQPKIIATKIPTTYRFVFWSGATYGLERATKLKILN